MPTVAEVLAEGLEHHRAGRWVEARRLYRRVLAFDRAQADALHLLGALELDAGPLDLAATLLGQSVAAAPSNPAAQANLGRARRRQGAAGAAATAFRRSLALAPDVPQIWGELGSSVDEEGDRARAFDRSLAIDPMVDEVLNNRAIQVYQQGDAACAGRLLRRALAVQPAGAGSWHNHGLVLRGRDRLMRAVAAFRRATTLNPRYADAIESEGWTRHLHLGLSTHDADPLAAALAGKVRFQPR